MRDVETLMDRLGALRAELARLNSVSSFTGFLGQDGENHDDSEALKKSIAAEIAEIEHEIDGLR